jgi:hypothetical protein
MAVTAQGAKVLASVDPTGGSATKGLEAIGLLSTVGSQAIIFPVDFWGIVKSIPAPKSAAARSRTPAS